MSVEPVVPSQVPVVIREEDYDKELVEIQVRATKLKEAQMAALAILSDQFKYSALLLQLMYQKFV